MKRNFLFLILLVVLCSCASKKYVSTTSSEEGGAEKFQATLNEAEEKASKEAREILILSRTMVTKKEKIRGSCWNYINTVFNRAGHGPKNRNIVFKSKLRGPYADAGLIRPGDWLYYVNHSYRGIEHSGIFVDWTDRKKKEALIMSYAGERRKNPARYKIYDLTNVYHIVRPK